MDVIAADWWIPAKDAAAVFAEAGSSDEVTTVWAQAHALPFEAESFHAVVSIDAVDPRNVAFDRAGAPRQSEAVDDGVPVVLREGDEALDRSTPLARGTTLPVRWCTTSHTPWANHPPATT
ncbi:hypothetical protein [Streptomyces sp. NPDC047718]|uniref:hypothetical protein n=1 Tax=Streptomyces sp. NPDC047718 TaxID=3155479 RepID=UPI0034033BD3